MYDKDAVATGATNTQIARTLGVSESNVGKVAGQRRNWVRWVIALALGLRQGEALGLQWSDINLGGACTT